jgi:hypothetical protein
MKKIEKIEKWKNKKLRTEKRRYGFYYLLTIALVQLKKNETSTKLDSNTGDHQRENDDSDWSDG